MTRGKKKKKQFKKAILKLLVLAALLKVKFEFLLKVMATHLQVKFFIIAALGLLLNAAKFWIDLKKGHSPQKVCPSLGLPNLACNYLIPEIMFS